MVKCNSNQLYYRICVYKQLKILDLSKEKRGAAFIQSKSTGLLWIYHCISVLIFSKLWLLLISCSIDPADDLSQSQFYSHSLFSDQTVSSFSKIYNFLLINDRFTSVENTYFLHNSSQFTRSDLAFSFLVVLEQQVSMVIVHWA